MSKNKWVGDPQDLQHYQPECATLTPPEIEDLTKQEFASYPSTHNDKSHAFDGPAFDNCRFVACEDSTYQYTIICWGSMMGSTFHVMRMPKDPDNIGG